jgi:hypothetical protein
VLTLGPRPEMVMVTEEERAPSRTHALVWRSRLVPTVGFLLLLVGAWWAMHREAESEQRPVVVHAEAREAGLEEGGTVGLGEEVLTAPVSSAAQPTSWSTLGLDMPRRPFPGQLKPDGHGQCPRKAQVAINGGCWIRLGDVRPPCAEEGYEWKGGCYYPVFDLPRQPTSDKR